MSHSPKGLLADHPCVRLKDGGILKRGWPPADITAKGRISAEEAEVCEIDCSAARRDIRLAGSCLEDFRG